MSNSEISNNSHLKSLWPKGQSMHLVVPETNLFYNLEVSANRFPSRTCLSCYGSNLSYAQTMKEVIALAGYLQNDCKVKHGDRVLLSIQNSMQFIIAFYAILRANAVVVPVNPMNITEELKHYITDANISTVITSHELVQQILPLVGEDQPVKHLVIACYSDYLNRPTDLAIPEVFALKAKPLEKAMLDHGVINWADAIALDRPAGPITAAAADLAVMPYTSGTTGKPKGCMHTHRSVMFNVVASAQWSSTCSDHRTLASLPFFHVTGMQSSMNAPIYLGCTIVLLPRWDRNVAARLIERYRITHWTAITTMVVDFLSNPAIDRHDLSSLTRLGGGGAAMPEAIATKLSNELGLDYIEGYGLSETMAPTHINPTEAPKKQCLGIPIYDTVAWVADPETLTPIKHGEVGEIVVRGPQLFQGYWNDPDKTAEAFFDYQGNQYFRTGDLGYRDEAGYYFFVDRIKRMINASGFKVWPAEIEAILFQHPAVREACIIAAKDSHRGETVKAVIVLKPEAKGSIDGEQIMDWARTKMSAYKVPRIVQFVDALPKGGTGKVDWRSLQDAELKN
jgi:fatty-acyl-CoA synthase